MWFHICVSTVVGRPRCWQMYSGDVLPRRWASHSVSVKTSCTSASWLCMRRCRWVAVCAVYALWTSWSVRST